jgi:hypothetical protein
MARIFPVGCGGSCEDGNLVWLWRRKKYFQFAYLVFDK